MADSKSLGILGFGFGGITVAIMLMAAVVVKGHVDGRLSLDNASGPVVSVTSPVTIR